MKNETRREDNANSLVRALPVIGPVLALVSMLVVAAIAATAVMMMM
jgi:hypothetical protein